MRFAARRRNPGSEVSATAPDPLEDGIDRTDLARVYVGMLARLATPDRSPALSKVIASGVLNKADPQDKEFIFGLERVLDGVAVLISRAGPAG